MNIEEYGLEPREKIVAAAVKLYLERCPDAMDGLIDARVVAFDTGEPLQTHIEGAQFAAFIDAAVEKAKFSLAGTDDLSRICQEVLRGVNGRRFVENVSPEFMRFLIDAYRA